MHRSQIPVRALSDDRPTHLADHHRYADAFNQAIYSADYTNHGFTLQDAIDLATFLVHTTIQMQRFSDGIRMAPGMSANCGGAIDVAVIEPENGFSWLSHKTLHAPPPAGIVNNSET